MSQLSGRSCKKCDHYKISKPNGILIGFCGYVSRKLSPKEIETISKWCPLTLTEAPPQLSISRIQAYCKNPNCIGDKHKIITYHEPLGYMVNCHNNCNVAFYVKPDG